MKRDTPSSRPRTVSLVLAAAVAAVVHFAHPASPHLGYVLAMSTMVLIGVQAFDILPVWPNRKRPEHPAAFGVFWGLVFGLIVPRLVVRYMEEGMAGFVDLLSAS